MCLILFFPVLGKSFNYHQQVGQSLGKVGLHSLEFQSRNWLHLDGQIGYWIFGKILPS